MREAAKNTDREIWREREGDYYSDSIHVTKNAGIGINCGGHVIVAPIKSWFKIADLIYNSETRGVSNWRKKLALWLLKADVKPKFLKK